MAPSTEPALTYGERLALAWLPVDGSAREWRQGFRGMPPRNAFLQLEARGLVARGRTNNIMLRWLTNAGMVIAAQLRGDEARDAARWRTMRAAGVPLEYKAGPDQPWKVQRYYGAEADALADFMAMCSDG